MIKNLRDDLYGAGPQRLKPRSGASLDRSAEALRHPKAACQIEAPPQLVALFQLRALFQARALCHLRVLRHLQTGYEVKALPLLKSTGAYWVPYAL